MKRYILAHWRGELSLAKSFLLNGVLVWLVFGLALPAVGLLIRSEGFVYGAFAVIVVWQVWAVVGIVRCVLRLFHEPHSAMLRTLALFALIVTAAAVYGTFLDVQLITRSIAG